jgi:predicted lactoylglutathione lyase
MIVGENIFVMLLIESFFETFTHKEICDTTRSAEAMVALSVASRAKVDEMVPAAVAAGGTAPSAAKDHGFMYLHGFEDPDGHLWEVFYMEPKAARRG